MNKNAPLHPTVESLVDALVTKTQNHDRQFFRVLVNYYVTKIAAMMRVSVTSEIMDPIPVNGYMINLSPSGTGKNYSMNIMEERVLEGFRAHFMGITLPMSADDWLTKAANRDMMITNRSFDEEYQKLSKRFQDLGEFMFSFDGGTIAATRQLRTNLLMANCGAMAMEVDEIGDKLSGEKEILSAFLELFDVGKIKQKLTKNTKENQRSQDLMGVTPACMLLFGTPNKLLNGGKTEDEFYEMLETGYARRSFFGYSREGQTPIADSEELYDLYSKSDKETILNTVSAQLRLLAGEHNLRQQISMPKETAHLYLEYKKDCTVRASKISEYEPVKKAELQHRHFKAMKLAGGYAFLDNTQDMTRGQLEAAIHFAEISGAALERIINRPRPYARLTHYLVSMGKPMTHADLIEDLTFYPKASHAQKDMLKLAQAHAIRENQQIKITQIDGVERIQGIELTKTNLDELIISTSGDQTENFVPHTISWDQLQGIAKTSGQKWCAHHFRPK